MTAEELKHSIDKLSFKHINFGHNVIKLASAKDFESWQKDFSAANNGSNNQTSSWKESWYVIAKDSLEDPHFIDLTDGKVYTAINEKNDWFPVPIADDLEHYINIINTLKELSDGRETPEKLEENPLTGDEIDDLMDSIHSQTEKDEEYHYWEYWLDE